MRIVAADPSWPRAFAWLAERIISAIGDDALRIEHVGSTSVPGPAAKPVIDIEFIVGDSRNEQAYVAALEQEGFVLVIREPWWYQHDTCVTTIRLAICTSSRQIVPRLNAIASSETGCATTQKIVRSTGRPSSSPPSTPERLMATTMDYTSRKEQALREIYNRASQSLGLTI